MKRLTGYLIDRATGVGVSGKTVTFKKLDGTDVTTADSYYQNVSSVTAADGKFSGEFELCPGPVNITVTVSGSEIKKRMHDEQVQFGGAIWSSDIGRIYQARDEGVIDNFLNEFNLSIPAGHTIRLATGGAVFNRGIFTIEHGNYDIAGTANPGGPNPRIDLITLRQYNDDAAGQLAGKQEVIVTLGSTANVAPSTPTGATFIDLPLWTVSTAQGASTKTIGTDLRSFTPAAAPSTAPFHSRTVAASDMSTSGTYTTWLTPTISGLDPTRIYDGEMVMTIHSESNDFSNEAPLWAKCVHANLVDGGFDEGVGISFGYGDWAYGPGEFSFFWPIVGITGVTSASFTVQLKDTNGQVKVYGTSGHPDITTMSGSYIWLRLRPRP